MKLLPQGLASLVAIACTSSVLAAHLDPTSDLNALGNNTLFNRWRPQFHFIAPAGWMNDPCGAMYNPTTETYHLMYQWHPNHIGWGNISWGHATSKDLVTWTDIHGWQNGDSQSLVTGPDGSPDHLGVFSGTAQPVGLHGQQDGNLTLFYTAVKHLPTNWRIPYTEGTETQSMATSSDGGLTWQKYPGNPVLGSPPEGWDVTGWRDPFFLPWPEMDTLLGQKEPHYYAILGSGQKNVGPRLPFYSAPASNLTNWTFLGALFDVPTNYSFGGDVTKTASYGFNFEVAGFFPLVEKQEDGGDGKTVHHFINAGSEGGDVPIHPNGHWALWAEGSVSKRQNGSVQFDIISSGAADWGNLYAVTSFLDTKNSRRVNWGWSEEDLGGYAVKPNGYQGALGLPREPFVHKRQNVVAPKSANIANASAVWKNDSKGTYTVTTLGVRPLPDVIKSLQKGSEPIRIQNMTLSSSKVLTSGRNATAVASDHFHLSASVSNIVGSAGFILRASPNREEQTIISYDVQQQHIHANRSQSTLIRNFITSSYFGSFAPYTIKQNGKAVEESLDFDVFVDGSLVEIFINGRFALTTRVYPSRDDALNIYAYVADGGSAKFENIKIWTGLGGAWPQRPQNSSSPLVWDSPELTNNGAWWDGL